jgi:hypothetical protein
MVDRFEDSVEPEVSLDEFRPFEALEDDPDAVEPPSAEEELHRVDPIIEVGEFETVDVEALAAEVGRDQRRDEVVSTDVDTEVAAEAAEDHEPAIDEILEVTTHSHDPAREHDWEPSAIPTETADELPPVRHRGEFLCSRCFLVHADHLRATHLGSGPDDYVCVDCASVEQRAPRA